MPPKSSTDCGRGGPEHAEVLHQTRSPFRERMPCDPGGVHAGYGSGIWVGRPRCCKKRRIMASLRPRRSSPRSGGQVRTLKPKVRASSPPSLELFGSNLIHVYPLVPRRRTEWPALGGEVGFESFGTVARAAGPRLGSVEIAATAAGVSVLHCHEVEVFFPVRALLGERRWTVAHFDPLDAFVVEPPRRIHVAQVFATGNRSPPKSASIDCARERRWTAGLDPGSDEVAHGLILQKMRALSTEWSWCKNGQNYPPGIPAFWFELWPFA